MLYFGGRLLILVEFRLIVFRPFKGEIITGRITGATETGIRGTEESVLQPGS